MSYATLMVYVDPDLSREHPVPIAAQLAAKFSSKLFGTSAIPIRAPVSANGIVINVITDDEITQMMERLEAKEAWFRERMNGSARAVEWRSELDFPTDFLVAQSRCTDLIVASPTGGLLGSYNSLDVAGVILKAGRPVLVVPDDLTSLAADRIVIGWKDTREARRAITDALPFMHEATQITIAKICEDEDESAARRSLDDVVQYLARHRIKCEQKILIHQDGSSATRLIRLAQDEGADLLVTGAYGHSRLGEWVFGGVTQQLLATSPICCLMSH